MQTDQTAMNEVRRLARDVLPMALDISSRTAELVLSKIPELAPAGDLEAIAAVRESTDQNIGAVFSTIAFGVDPTTIEPPAGTKVLLSNLAAADGNIIDLLRAYRIGQEFLWQIWSERVFAEIGDPDLLPQILQIFSTHLFAYIDRICQRIVESAAANGSDLGPSQPVDRAELVSLLLGSAPTDLGQASATLRYDLARHHVAVLVSPISEGADVRQQLDRLLAATSVPALAIPSGQGNWWAWFGFPAPPEDEELAAIAGVRITGVVAGMGEPAQGREGFRRSLAQAREAERVARLGSAPSPGLIRYRHAEIAAMLCADPERARDLAATRLGRLADRDETGTRLRATVRAVLAHGYNRARAADELHVHHKTVAYRISQAEELLGTSLSEESFTLQVALLIDQTLNGP